MKKSKLLVVLFSTLLVGVTLPACNISSKNVTEIILNRDEVSLLGGEEFQLEVSYQPEKATNLDFGYVSSDESVATVDQNGLIISNNVDGQCTITCTSKYDASISDNIVVNVKSRVRVESIESAFESYDLSLSDYACIDAYTLPENANNTALNYKIADESIASIVDDVIYPKKEGSTQLIITSKETNSKVEKKIDLNISAGEGATYLTTVEGTDVISKISYYDLYKTVNGETLPSIASEENPQKVLVIPVEFSDYPFSKSTLADLEVCFSGDGKDDTGYWESVKTYFQKSSFGKLNFEFDIANVYKTNKTAEESVPSSNDVGSVVQAAVDFYKVSTGDDLTQYDSNNDGIVDSIWFIYSRPNSMNKWTSDGTRFWAYVTYEQNVATSNSVIYNRYGWASYDFMYQHKRTGVDAHTFIHETGHMMGLSDYYNYTQNNAPTGFFDMQDANVGDHNAWSKAALGWIDPIVYESELAHDTTKIHLEPSALTGDALFITPEFFGTVFDEFIVLELYTPTGLNELDATHVYAELGLAMPNTYGVKMYHVDSRLITSVGTQTAQQKYYDYSSLSNGFKVTNGWAMVGASNTNNYDRNYTKELFRQLTLVSSKTTTTGTYLMKNATYSEDDFFETGDIFTMSKYARSFENGKVLNSGKELNIKIKFDKVTANGCDLTITLN